MAHHVRQNLENRFSRRVADSVVGTLERFPILLKQLNSALILLSREAGNGNTRGIAAGVEPTTITTREPLTASATK